MSQTIAILQHSTDFDFLEPILRSGALFTRGSLGLPGGNGEPHPDFVFFTPYTEIQVPLLKDHQVYLFFDAPSILATIPYFINEGNAFGPLDGKKVEGSCSCSRTYHHRLDAIVPPPSNECGKKSLTSFLKFVKINEIDRCDGGPEVGVYGNVSLDFLVGIAITRAAFGHLPEDLRTDPRFKEKFLFAEPEPPKPPRSALVNSIYGKKPAGGAGNTRRQRRRQTRRKRSKY